MKRKFLPRYLLKTFIILVCCAFCLLNVNPVKAKEAFTIKYHSVDVIVNEDGSLNITERMDVTFTSDRHGIYVNLPTTYIMDLDGNGSKTYYFPIKDIKVISGQEYHSDFENDYVTIQIGDDDHYAPKNSTYVFSYTIITRDLNLDGKQMLYLNLFTNGWDTTTDKCEFTITFPKDFSNDDIKTIYAKGEVDGLANENGLTLTRQANVLKGSYTNVLQADEGLSIQVALVDDYFQFPTLKKEASIINACSSIFALVIFIVFLIKGRDNQLHVTSQYHLPVNVTSSEVGLIIDEEVNENDLISLILDWGRRGLITINEKGGELYLNKVAELESDSHRFEKIIFEKIFDKKKEVCVDKLKYKFHPTLEKARKALEKEYEQKKKRLTTKESITLQWICIFIGFIPVTAFISILSYMYTYNFGLVIAIFCVLVMCIIGINWLACYTYQKRFMFKPISKILISLLICLFYVGLLLGCLKICKLTSISYRYGISEFLLQVMILILTVGMRKRTEHGDEMLESVLGLRKFILENDQRKIEELNEENPFYFYDILPFAYAMGLTDVWAEHFEGLKIDPCDWFGFGNDQVYESYYIGQLLCDRMDSISKTMRSVDSSSSDYDGGGYSGGSSGGGFGGSSGGSW